jgi:hypothetical protein
LLPFKYDNVLYGREYINKEINSAPLNRLTSKEANWKEGGLPQNCLEAFNSLKQSLILEPIVDYPRKHRP